MVALANQVYAEILPTHAYYVVKQGYVWCFDPKSS